jgi:DNA (cytosine-5)-methyltransferase 1
MYGKPTKNMYPTPVVSDHLHNQSESIENWQKRAKEKKKQGINLHFALRHHVQMYPTPTQDSASERTKKYSQGGMPLPMAVKMFPTPTAGCVEGGEQSSRVEMTEKGGFILRKKNKPENTFGAKLSDAMLYLEKKQQTKPGGRLNPNFVEFLMGYPMNWTKIDPTE